MYGAYVWYYCSYTLRILDNPKTSLKVYHIRYLPFSRNITCPIEYHYSTKKYTYRILARKSRFLLSLFNIESKMRRKSSLRNG